jgi:hypothetical protein
MYRVQALKTIYEGTQLCMGTSIPKRYRVAKDGVLDDFDDSVSQRMARKSAGIPIAVKCEKKRKTETVDLKLL